MSPHHFMLITPQGGDRPSTLDIGKVRVSTHGYHWNTLNWRVIAEELPLNTPSLPTGSLLAWPAPRQWEAWEQIARTKTLRNALRALRLFALNGYWQEGSRLPEMLDLHGASSVEFWDTLLTLASDGAPPIIAANAARLL